MKRSLPLLAALGSGVLLALALPLVVPFFGHREVDPAGHLELVAWFALVPLVLAVDRARSARAAAGLGLVGGLAYFYASIHWVNHAMVAFGGLPWSLSLFALTLLVLFMAAHWSAAFAVAWKIKAGLRWPMWWHLPFVWVAFELLRNHLFSGFPWANVGYTQVRHLSVAQLAALGGVYAVAALVVLVNAVLAEVVKRRRAGEGIPWRPAAGTAALVLVVVGFGELRLADVRARSAAAPKLRVGIVQPNINQSVKNVAASRGEYVLERLVPLTLEADRAGADLVAWPEAAFPWHVRPSSRTDFSDPRFGLPALERAHLLLGASAVDFVRGAEGKRVPRLENSVFLLTPERRSLGKYVKHHLVPFGEYVPLQRWLPFLGKVVPSFAPAIPGNDLNVLGFPVASRDAPSVPLTARPEPGAGRTDVATLGEIVRPEPVEGRTDAATQGESVRPEPVEGRTDVVTRGESVRPEPVEGRTDVATLDVATLAPLICFDAIFPEITVAFGRRTPEPDVLVNPTNDAWYGYSSGPYQFLAIVRMRAIEAGKAVIRPAYAGVSALILPTGEVVPGALEVGPVEPERAPDPEEPARLLLGEVPRLRGRTPYTTVGDLFAYACTLAAAVALAGAWRAGVARRGSPEESPWPRPSPSASKS
jgi:apolipoprotein N-acyltransferase